MRSPTKLLVKWRLVDEPGAGMEAAYVVDLSARGARVLAEDREGRVVGAEVKVDVGRHHFSGWIRRAEAHGKRNEPTDAERSEPPSERHVAI